MGIRKIILLLVFSFCLIQSVVAETKLSEIPLHEATGLTKEHIELDKNTIIRQASPNNLEAGTAACVPGRTMRVWWDRIHVCRTPNDSGSYEEWRSRLDAGIPSHILYWSRSHSPPDNLSLPTTDPFACWNHTVGKRGYLNEIPSDIPYIFQHHYGYESDKWPNADDKIPNYWDLELFDNCAGNYTWLTSCGWTSDYKRYSCTSVQYYTY